MFSRKSLEEVQLAYWLQKDRKEFQLTLMDFGIEESLANTISRRISLIPKDLLAEMRESYEDYKIIFTLYDDDNKKIINDKTVEKINLYIKNYLVNQLSNKFPIGKFFVKSIKKDKYLEFTLSWRF